MNRAANLSSDRRPNTFRVGQDVHVLPYSDDMSAWVAGYTVVAVEWEDCVVERAGVRTVVGINRMRAAVDT